MKRADAKQAVERRDSLLCPQPFRSIKSMDSNWGQSGLSQLSTAYLACSRGLQFAVLADNCRLKPTAARSSVRHVERA